jgi:hypothetical protein
MTASVAPHKGRIVVQSFFGPRIVDGRPGFHPGIDVTGDEPTGPLYSMHSGTVVAQWSYQPDKSKEHRRAKNILVVSDDGTGILYSGLSENKKILSGNKMIPIGTQVAAGDEIGVAGNTDAGRYHTHIEVVTPQGIARMGLTRGQDAEGKSIWLFGGKPLSDSTNDDVGKGYSLATRTGLPNTINGDAYRQDVLIPGDLVVPYAQVSPKASAQLPQINQWSRATRDAANQLHPYLAETLQADRLFSGRNSFNPAGLPPAEIDRFYTATANPSADTRAALANGVPRVAAVPYLESTNAAHQFLAKVPPSNVPLPSGVTPSGTIAPGNPQLPNGFPTRPLPQKRSAAPDGPAWDLAQGATPATSAFQQDAAYSPAGDVQALAQRIARMLGGAGRFNGNSLVSPAEAASPSEPLLRGATAPNAPSATPIADLSAGAYFPGSALAAETDGSAPSVANKDFRYLTRKVADKPQASVFDTGAPAVPFVPSDSPDFSGGLSSLPFRFLTRVDPRDPGLAALPQQTARSLGIVSGARVVIGTLTANP